MARLTVAVLLLITGVMLMLVLHLLMIAWAIRRGAALRLRGASPRDEEEHAEATTGLTAEELGELPCQDFKAAALGAPGGECAVCLEAFVAGDWCRVMPACQHGFHAQCVDSWLRKSRQCPVCRAEVVCRGKAAGGVVVDEAATSESVDERLGGADR